MELDVNAEINRIKYQLCMAQSEDGSWRYPFETGIATDCYMIILLRTLEINDEELIERLVERIISKQEQDSSWKLFYDQDKGSVTATVEAYYALLYSGYKKKGDKEIRAAKRFILSEGGIEEVHMFTKVMLAMTGQYPWLHFPVSMNVMLLPDSSPINLFDFSVYGRSNLVPLLVVADCQFSLKTKRSPDLADLFQKRGALDFKDSYFGNDQEEWRSLFTLLHQGMQILKGLPNQLHSAALSRAEQYMINRIEPDGTLTNYFSSTFLMIFAFLARGYSKTHPLITRAVEGLKSMITEIDGRIHCQYTTATVWNTTLAGYVLQEAGVPCSSDIIQKANRYLLSRQHFKYGDWAIHNPNVLPGGWGFENMDTIHPDIDDTTAALRAIRTYAMAEGPYRQAWDRGINWVISMQNSDGGWAAFEKNVNKKILDLLPVEGGKDLLIDPSTVDLTGRTLEFFGNYTHLDWHHPMIKRGIHWLMRHQRKDGSWLGRWGVYIYGTWTAVTGLVAVGIAPDHHAIQKGLNWLCEIQNPDGGWGESCKSDILKRYAPLGASTRTHTAWALDALIVAATEKTPEIERGIQFLLEGKEEDWTHFYPKGRGMAGAFYIDYHCYEYVWPLLALAHYQQKFN